MPVTFFPFWFGGSTVNGYFYTFTGDVGATLVTTIERYNFANNAVTTVGTNLSTTRGYASAVGNTTIGLIAGGAPGTGLSGGSDRQSTEKFTYSSEAIVAGTNLGSTRKGHTAVGNATQGYTAGDFNGNQAIIKYVYSSDTVTSPTNLVAQVMYVPAGASGPDYGIRACGINYSGGADVATTDKITYTTDACIAGSTLANVRRNPRGSGNQTAGYIISGNQVGVDTAYNEKYVWASAAVSTVTALTTAQSGGGAAGALGDTLILSGGFSSGTARLNTNHLYSMSGDSWSAGTTLAAGRNENCGTSTNPSHL